MHIRLATHDDAPDIQAIYAPIVRDTAISFELTPPNADAIRERISTTLETHPWLVCEQDGAVIGYAYAGKHRKREAYQWATEVSAYVHDDHKKQGVGRTLYERLFAILASQGFFNAYAGIVLPNDASVGFHSALGFTLVGNYQKIGYKFGAWHDVAWYQRPLRDYTADPYPPIALPDVPDKVIARLLIE